MSNLKLEGKVAIVIGASSGIGEVTARLFVDNGAFVVFTDIQDKLGHGVVALLDLTKCCYNHCDVREENQVQEIVDHAIEKYGRLDIFFSNAGVVGGHNNILDLDLQKLDNTIAINVHGAVAMVKHAARVMVAKEIRGSIICTTKVASYLGDNAAHGYTISKHAVVGLVQSAASKLGRHGIRVNYISPFSIATPLVCQFTNLEAHQVEGNSSAHSNLKGIVLKPQHIAEVTLFSPLMNQPSSAGITLSSTGVSLWFAMATYLSNGTITLIV